MTAVSVLMVDDDPSQLKIARRLFAAHAELATADDPASARVLLASRSFDVVVSDFSMPGEDGLSLLRHVAEVCPGARRILFTGAMPAEAQAQLESGAIDHVVAKAGGVPALVPLLKRRG